MRLAIGLLLTVVAFAVAGRRLVFLARIFRSGQPAVGRTDDVGTRIKTQFTEVIGQRKLLKWSVPGIAHAFTFWGFVVLGLTIVEAYGALFDPHFAFPVFGTWGVVGFVEDFFAVAVLCGLATFTVIRFRQSPKTLGRWSRFFGSHTGAAWLVLFMIFNVIWTLLFYRGAQQNTGNFPYQPYPWSFASWTCAQILSPLGDLNEGLETFFILLNIAVILVFLVIVVYSKHLHIFLAPLNVLFSRRPKALGAALPMISKGQPVNFEDPGEDDVLGVGKVEDFTWKGLLDFATCTECGRCQSQCPAWNTEKPLSPKLLIMNLRDHAFAKAPYLQAAEDKRASLPADVLAEAERPLVAPVVLDDHGHPTAEGGVIDPDVLWSCVTCGACVEQCPVDIEHVDHILDMRRYQVMVESAFPSEAGVMLRNLEQQGNPWGLPARKRLDWTDGLPFEIRVFGAEGEEKIPDNVDYLYWVGCAGASEDRAMKTARTVAELLHAAGVDFMVLGEMEACTGDPARRLGAEYVFQMLGQQNVETLNEIGAKKIVATCPHCFNSLANEYPQLGGHYEVVHHTQLLSRLVTEGRLVPVQPIEKKITYHDPCYLGRHNEVYTPPREVLSSIPGLASQEMHRCKDRGFCCGAGGARMWMEEKIGKRINIERVDEALGLDPDLISTACPFCMVMLSDAVTAKQSAGEAREGVAVVDVATLLKDSLAASNQG